MAEHVVAVAADERDRRRRRGAARARTSPRTAGRSDTPSAPRRRAYSSIRPGARGRLKTGPRRPNHSRAMEAHLRAMDGVRWRDAVDPEIEDRLAAAVDELAVLPVLDATVASGSSPPSRTPTPPQRRSSPCWRATRTVRPPPARPSPRARPRAAAAGAHDPPGGHGHRAPGVASPRARGGRPPVPCRDARGRLRPRAPASQRRRRRLRRHQRSPSAPAARPPSRISPRSCTTPASSVLALAFTPPTCAALALGARTPRARAAPSAPGWASTTRWRARCSPSAGTSTRGCPKRSPSTTAVRPGRPRRPRDRRRPGRRPDPAPRVRR